MIVTIAIITAVATMIATIAIITAVAMMIATIAIITAVATREVTTIDVVVVIRFPIWESDNDSVAVALP